MRASRNVVATGLLLLTALTAGCHSSTQANQSSTTLCQAPAGANWTQALAGRVVTLSRHASVTPWALVGDGRTFFASVYSKRFSGVAAVAATESRVTPIKRFGSPRNDQAVGAFDGRWLVWTEYHSLYGSDDFTTWSWDSSSGRLRRIGRATRMSSGEFWPSPSRPPDVRDGFATWSQGSGRGGLADVHVFDLAHGRDRIVRRGHPAGSFLVAGGLVVWPESPRPGALTEMRAADVTSGRAVAAPSALRALRGVSGLATDGGALAYPNADYTSLWWSPSLATPARRVYATGNPGSHIDNSVQVAGRWVVFGVPPALYLADLMSGRYAKLSAGGYGRLDARTLVLLKATDSKAIHPIADVVFLPLASLPAIPACG